MNVRLTCFLNFPVVEVSANADAGTVYAGVGKSVKRARTIRAAG
jgi:hypothetical protein